MSKPNQKNTLDNIAIKAGTKLFVEAFVDNINKEEYVNDNNKQINKKSGIYVC